MTFIRFMASGSGRILRIVAGLAISGAGVYLLTAGSIARLAARVRLYIMIPLHLLQREDQ